MKHTRRGVVGVWAYAVVFLMGLAPMSAQQAQPAPPTNGASPAGGSAAVTPPPDYVIGPEDVLHVMFWREKDMSAEVVVRPDGNISLPLLNEVRAAGLSPEQLRDELTQAAGRLLEEPTVAVVVKQINSRKVFITGNVGKPGPYPLFAPTTVLQLIATAGGVLEYAKAKNIVVMRTENGKPVRHRFNYSDVIKGRNLKQNIELMPGDTVIVP